MSPNPPIARKKLKYPLYGADFDPLNHDFLIVGGGGGSASTGVPNKISLLDTSRFTELNEITDIELARDEDSVTSLAVAQSDGSSLIAYAGVNGSTRDQEQGRNEHFRSFRIGLPSRKRKAAAEDTSEVKAPQQLSNEALGRVALFRAATGPRIETYQRVLKVSQANGGENGITAIASGMAPQNEVIVLRTTKSPSQSDVLSRLAVEKEANDLDIISQADESQTYLLAYCTDHEIYIQSVTPKKQDIKEPVKVYGNSGSVQGSKIRAIRWLTPRFIILLRNRPGKTGAELAVLKTDVDHIAAQVVLVSRLTRRTKQAVGLDICALSRSTSGDQQFIIAAAGQASSLEIFTLDFHQTSGMDKLKQYTYLTEIHSGPITRIIFSRFSPPTLPVTKDTKPQYVRLATVGVDQVVSVITLPLRPHPATSSTPRYTLVTPPETLQNAINITVALLVIGLTALFMQIFCEVRGAVPSLLGATDWLSPAWQSRIARPYEHIRAPVIVDSLPPTVSTATESISSVVSTATESVHEAVQAAIDAAAESGNSILHHLVSAPETADKAIVIRDSAGTESGKGEEGVEGSSLSAEVHNHDSEPVKSETLKKWDELTEKQKRSWRRKLVDAGHWSEKQGESILKGILFSELGGIVGAAVRGG